MTQETINLLIGGGIGIIASLITTIFAHWFQTGREKQKRIWEEEDETQKREWELEDRYRNEKREIYLKRISQVEEYGTNVVNFMNALINTFAKN